MPVVFGEGGPWWRRGQRPCPGTWDTGEGPSAQPQPSHGGALGTRGGGEEGRGRVGPYLSPCVSTLNFVPSAHGQFLKSSNAKGGQ